MAEEGLTAPEERNRLAARHLVARAHAPSRTPRQRLRLSLLRCWGRLFRTRWQRPPASNESPRTILVIRPDHLGDLLFTLPALRHLRTAFPQAHIAGAIGPWGAPLLAEAAILDEQITLPFPGFTRAPKGSPLSPYHLLWQEARALRDRRFDAAIVLRFDHWWGALLAAMAHIPLRIGYDIPEVRPFLTRPVPYLSGHHEVIQNLRLVTTLSGIEDPARTGTTWQDTPLDLPTSEADEAWAGEFLRRHGDPSSVIAIHAGAGAPVKLWREAAWREVAEAVARRWHGAVLLTGTAQERPLAERITQGLSPPPIIAAGETTLGQLAALLRRARLAIGPDSGPLHLAVAVGTPTIHLYGPVDVSRFGPWGDAFRHRSLTSRWACIPCNRLDYGEGELAAHGCVRDITVEQVLAAVEGSLRTG